MVEVGQIALSDLLGHHFDYMRPRWADGGRDFAQDLLRIKSKEHLYGLHSHSARVSYIATKVGEAQGLPSDKLVLLTRASQLHDVGKTDLPDILFMKGELSKAEKDLVDTHVLRGFERVWPYFPSEAKIIAAHHLFQENAYPVGWVIERSEPDLYYMQVSLALADQTDAFLSERSYRPAWTDQATREKLLGMFGSEDLVNYAVALRASIV